MKAAIEDNGDTRLRGRAGMVILQCCSSWRGECSRESRADGGSCAEG